MKTKKNISAILLVFAFSTNSFAHEGEKLFRANCSGCHSIGQGKLVGPDLKGVNTRHDEAWLLKWIKSSQTMVKSGDKKSIQIYNDNFNLVMPDQNLSDDEIKSVLAFVQEKEKSVATEQKSAIDVSVISSKSPAQANGTLLSVLDFSGYILIMLMGLALIIIWVMSMSVKALSIELKEKIKS